MIKKILVLSEKQNVREAFLVSVLLILISLSAIYINKTQIY